MMKIWSKNLGLAVLLAVGAGVLAIYLFGLFSRHEPVARMQAQGVRVEAKYRAIPKTPDTRDNGKEVHTAAASTAASNVLFAGKSASRIYNDSKLTLADRFHALMNLEYQGDSVARYFAYRMRETCRISGEMSKDNVLPEVWSQGMAAALKTLRTRCEPLVEDPLFQDFSEQVKGLNLYSFNSDIPLHIKQTFADSGAKAAVATALVAFRGRPDTHTAMLTAETLAKLDILTFDPDFQINGTSAAVPAMREGIFWVALMLYSCDLGVPCGPDSGRMLRLRAFGGAQPGQSLYDYFAYTMPPQDMRNVDTILAALHRVPLFSSQ